MAKENKHQGNCRHLLGDISDYIDESASQEICERIERHLAECEDCRIVVDTMRKTVYLVHATAEPADMPDDVRQRLFKRLELDDLLKDS